MKGTLSSIRVENLSYSAASASYYYGPNLTIENAKNRDVTFKGEMKLHNLNGEGLVVKPGNLEFGAICSKHKDQMRKMVTRESSPGKSIFICNECVEICRSIMEEETEDDRNQWASFFSSGRNPPYGNMVVGSRFSRSSPTE